MSRATHLLALSVALATGPASTIAEDDIPTVTEDDIPPVAPTLASPPRQTRRPRVALSTAAFEDSNGVSSLAPRLVGALPVAGAELRLCAGAFRAARRDEEASRSIVGAGLSVPWGRARIDGAYALHGPTNHGLQEVDLAVAWEPLDALGGAVAARRRPFVETAETFATDAQAFHSAGPGGASDPLAVFRLEVNELRVTAHGSPSGWSYLYADVRRLWILGGGAPVGGKPVEDRDNRGWTAAAGGGVMPISALWGPGPLDLTLRWDAWIASYDSVRLAYYSPGRVVSHVPSAELRWRHRWLEIAAEGGVTYAPTDRAWGWLAGALASARLGRLRAVAHWQARDDPWYRSNRIWLAIESAL
jgi:hypothetical protein